jgi:UDPglucose--hexose-1-phosphate uridylyltransferase
VYGFPFVPPVAARELAAQKAHWEHTGGGLLEAHLRAEVADGRRMLYEGAEAVAFVPVCARYPYEVWIAPRKPAALLPELGDAQRADLARALKIVLMKYDRLWERPMPYLLVLHQAPTDERPHPEAHVHLELYPAHHLPGRRKVAGSTELGAGVFSAEALPEDTARQLREVKAEVDEDVQPT